MGIKVNDSFEHWFYDPLTGKRVFVLIGLVLIAVVVRLLSRKLSCMVRKNTAPQPDELAQDTDDEAAVKSDQAVPTAHRTCICAQNVIVEKHHIGTELPGACAFAVA